MASNKQQFKKVNAPRPQTTDDMTPNNETGGIAAPTPAKNPFKVSKDRQLAPHLTPIKLRYQLIDGQIKTTGAN